MWITASDTLNTWFVRTYLLIAPCDNTVPVRTPYCVTEKCFYYCLEIVFLNPDNIIVLISHKPKWSTD